MENLKGQYLDNLYMVLAPLKNGDDPATFLVKNQDLGSIAVKKRISPLQFPVYEKLKEFPHPNLSRVLELYSLDGRHYVIEEYISGTTLQQELDQGTFFPEAVAVNYMNQLCNVLAFLHSHNIIHRDITPSNILISTDGVLKLIDFGISRTKKAGQTQDTTFLGTVGYAPPEQFGFGQTDERSDLYAAGVVFNVLLTGKPPMEALPGNPYYRQTVLRCTSLDPADRFHSAYGLASHLNRGAPTANLPPEPPRKEALFFKILHMIPGFRTGDPLHMLLAVPGYFLLALISWGGFTGPLEGGTLRLELIVTLVFLFYLPWAAYVDLGYYTRRLRIFKNRGPFAKTLLKTVFALLSVIICILCYYAIDFFKQ